MSGAAEAKSPKPHGPGGFEDIVKDFWVSRPRRPRVGRKIAGVAAALGNRYGIDPVVIRVAFVAAALFGGVGVLLYLLGWLFFAEEHDQVSAFEGMINRGRSSTSTGFTVVLCLALIPASGWAFSGGWFGNGFLGGGLVWLALSGAALYLLHRNRGHVNRPVEPVGSYGTFGPTDVAAEFSMSSTGATAEAPGAPPSWDPLGAAPLAWDLPDPAPARNPPPPPTARRHKSKTGPATLGIAVLVAGAGAALGITGHNWFSPQHIVGLTLGVLGIGLVAGAFVRSGRGLVTLAIPLSIAGLVLTSVPLGTFRGGLGDLDAVPLTAAELKPIYQRAAGNIELNLTKLPADVPVNTTLINGAGNTTVTVPWNADVQYSCQSTAGTVECLGRETNGIGNDPVTGDDAGMDGVGGPKITLKLENTAGNVEVRRG